MGRKGRHTAKTGDVAVYKSRGNEKKQKQQNDDDMYNEVDKYHNRRDQEEFLRFNTENDNGGDDEIEQEAVLDLGLDVHDDDQSSSSSSSDEEESQADNKDEGPSDEEDVASSFSDDDDMEQEEEDVLDWGTSKSQYYDGDTADLEIGQDQEDAIVEEEAAQDVLKARYQTMEEEDYLLDDAPTDQEKKQVEEVPTVATKASLHKRSKREVQKFLESHHHEALPLLNHFSDIVHEYNEKTSVVTNTLLQADKETIQEIGTTPAGLQYLIMKSTLQASISLHVALYLLLKSEQEKDGDQDVMPSLAGGSDAFSHPILTRLKQLNAMLQKLTDQVEEQGQNNDGKDGGLLEQMEKLLQATELMKSENTNDSYIEESKVEVEEAENDKIHQFTESSPSYSESENGSEKDLNDSEVKDVEFEGNEDDDEEEVARGVLNEARFGLRLQEVERSGRTNKRQRRDQYLWSKYDSDEEDESNGLRASRSLASTMNTMEQRSQTRKRRAAPAPQEEDNGNPENDFDRGLAMMEEEGLFASDKEIDEENHDLDSNDVSDDDGDFYSQVKKHVKAKKADKESLYRVAPKYPGMEQELEGERAIGRSIMKNRGLVAHKSKANRNPRVKKREQYRKALIRRKGAVREVRTNEGNKYGGEETGIKSKLSRSRKLGVK